MLNTCPRYEDWYYWWWQSGSCRSDRCVSRCPEHLCLWPWQVYAGAPPWAVCHQEQSTVRVGCDALCAQMWDALPHVRCSLQSHPGEALYQIGRWQSCAPMFSSWSPWAIWWVDQSEVRCPAWWFRWEVIGTLDSYLSILCLHLWCIPGHSDALDSCVSSFQSENSAGRIKIKELAWILLHGSWPGVSFSSLLTSSAFTPLWLDFGSGLGCLGDLVERKLVLFRVWGVKGNVFMSNPLGVRPRPETMKQSDLSLHRSKMLRELDLLYPRGFRPLLG